MAKSIYKREPCIWGKQVKTALFERSLTQKDLVNHLNSCGHKINAQGLNNLIYGAAALRIDVIESINAFLGISA